MEAINSDRTKVNAGILDEVDSLTHELDVFREGHISGLSKKFSSRAAQLYNERLSKFEDNLTRDKSMPVKGIPIDEPLLRHYRLLVNEMNEYVSGINLEKIPVRQLEHRTQDMARLARYFIDFFDFEEASRVLLLDPNKPLEPQLGYDPDSI